ncbi:MAG: WD40/YVTN/BNR-like repeat-containing protein [Bacteroidota bacterium]
MFKSFIYQKKKPFIHLILTTLSLLITEIYGSNQNHSKPPHLRGLTVTRNNTVWASGTQSTLLRGKFDASHELRFDTCKSPYPGKDFRDIWALDQNTAVAMSIADSAVVIKTTDGGHHWVTVYHDETPGIFLDVIEIDPLTGVGIILGDPLNGHFKALFTTDYGSSWMEIPAGDWNTPSDSLESFFAASGTSLSIIDTKANRKKQKFAITASFAGGGLNPQFHLVQIQYQAPKAPSIRSSPSSTTAQQETPIPNPADPSKYHWNVDAWKIQELPKQTLHLKGGPAWGCYGLTTYQTQKGIAVGGNYVQPNFQGDSSGAIAAYTPNILGQWYPAATPPRGYRSGVCISAPINKDTVFNLFFGDSRNRCQSFYNAFGKQPADFFYTTHRKKSITMSICTGTSGTDVSFDGGIHWLALSNERGFNACTWSCNTLILAGNLGKIESLSLREISGMFQKLNPLEATR